ncbi:hypothetical protein R1flu_003071 [Riccia fluitans]|uniref:Uncharacterized protein n=1 Tax=Riccia fluitans TaxID=41844 RepID=A0ABD1Y7Y6_9MARC
MKLTIRGVWCGFLSMPAFKKYVGNRLPLLLAPAAVVEGNFHRRCPFSCEECPSKDSPNPQFDSKCPASLLEFRPSVLPETL